MVCNCTLLLVSSVVIVAVYFLRKLAQHGMYTKPTLIDGKIVLITGANTGIGKETAIDLARRGGKIYIACRNKVRGENALNDIRKQSGNENVHLLLLDLASLKSIREFSKKFHQLENKLDILVNNAGLLTQKRSVTEDGFEMHMGVNHLGHFLLTNLLLDMLKAAAPSRIVVVSSLIHKFDKMAKLDRDDFMTEKDYDGYKGYGRSKLANVLFIRELSKRLQGTKVTVNSCHPGAIKTDIIRDRNSSFMSIVTAIILKTPFIKTPVQGAQMQIKLAVDPDLEDVTGKYFSNLKEEKPSSEALNDDTAKWLWEKSCQLVSL